jgi:hypothetical protein
MRESQTWHLLGEQTAQRSQGNAEGVMTEYYLLSHSGLPDFLVALHVQ